MMQILILRIVNLVMFAVNIALFGLWFSLIKIDVVHVKEEASNYLLSEVSAQVTVLGVIVTFAALLLAGLGFFGFQAIMERAENRADTVARVEVARRFEEWMRQYNPATFRVNSGAAQDAPTTTGAVEARGL